MPHRRVDSGLAHLPVVHAEANLDALQAEAFVDVHSTGNARRRQGAVAPGGCIGCPEDAVQQNEVACH